MSIPSSIAFSMNKLAPVAVLVFGLSMTFMAWNSAIEDIRQVEREKFDFRVDKIAGNINERLKSYELVLLGASSFFSKPDFVERNEFRNYVAKLLLEKNYPGIQGVGFSLRISPADKQRHIEKIRRDGFPDYNLKPAGERDSYSAVIYLEPFDWRNQRAFGYDMYSEPVRRSAMDRATDEGGNVISGRVTLVQETEKDIQWGFLMYIPVYRKGAAIGSIEERRRNLLGWTYSPFRMNDLMKGILGKEYGEVQSFFDMEIFDGRTADIKNRMYHSSAEIITPPSRSGFNANRKIEFGRHVWTLAVHSRQDHETSEAIHRIRVTGFAGVVISLLVSLTVWLLLNGRTRAINLAEKMAARFQESESRSSAVMESMVDGVITIDSQGKIGSFNKAAEKIFGYTVAEVIGNNVKMLMPEPYRSEHDGYLRNYIATGNKKIIGIGREVVGRRKDGTTFPMELAVSEIFIASTRMFSGVVRDISEHKRITDQLWLQGAALEAAANAIVITSVEGTIQWVNHAFTQLTGYEAEEAIGRKTNMLKSGQQSQEYYRDLWSTVLSGDVWQGEMINRRKDGSTYAEEQTITPVKDKEGRISRFIAIKQDITRRKEAEERLSSVTALRKAILDSANFSIISTDVNGMIQTFNRGAERMLGYAADEMVDRETPAILHDSEEVMQRAGELSVELGQDIKPGFETFIAKARLGIADERKWTYIRKDGSRFPVLLSITAIFDADGRPDSYLGIASDITESVKIEHMKNEFVSTVSHELRTPLTSIRGALGLIVGGVAGKLPEKAKSLVDIAHKNSERLILLVNDILDMEKIASGKMSFNLKQVDIVSLARQALETNRSYGEQFKVDFVLADTLPECNVEADADRLMQVMANLLSNAAKFSLPGKAVTVSISCNNQNAHVAVADRGPGIPEEFRDKIFQKFSQADSSDSKQKSGSGLGLYITRELVERMGGTVGFKTVTGEGTTFFFEVPLWKEKVAHWGSAEKEGETRILICESNASISSLLQRVVMEAGFVPELVSDAVHARVKLQEKAYHGLILDAMLPGQDGMSLLRELRNSDALTQLPVVVLSAEGASDVSGLAGGVSVLDWLSAPVDRGRMLAALRRVASGSNGIPKILHVEDDLDLREILSALLAKDARMTGASTLHEAKRRLEQQHFDLVILDIGLPDGSGADLLPFLNEKGIATPVMIFSAGDVDENMGQQVAAALVKSRTSNDQLRAKIQQLIKYTRN